MTGGLRTSATDIMEAHADVLPFNLQVDRLCHRSAVRLTTLLNCHSLAPHVRKAARRFVKRHRCPLHELMDAFKQHLYSKNTERIRSTRLHPRWHPQHHVKMLDDRKAAIEDDPKWAKGGAYRVYTSGSDIDGGVGAAVVLFPPERRRPRILKYRLGPSTSHTVYEAEIVGTILATELLRTEPHLTPRVSIALDNNPTIQASTLRTAAPGCYLADTFHRALTRLLSVHPGTRVTLRWVFGHKGVKRNERADEEAKAAAGGESSPAATLPKELRRPLPTSASQLRQSFKTHLSTTAETRWNSSRRCNRKSSATGPCHPVLREDSGVAAPAP